MPCRKWVYCLVGALCMLAFAGGTPAFGASPLWKITSSETPANLLPGSEGLLYVSVANLGDATADTGGGSPVVVSDTLPKGLTVTSVEGRGAVSCAIVSASSVRCMEAEPVPPFGTLESGHLAFEIHVQVAESAASGTENEVSVSGGEAASVSAGRPITISERPSGFGVEQYELVASNEDGSLDTQAGSHPFNLTATLNFNTEIKGTNVLGAPFQRPSGEGKELRFLLPQGLVGDPDAVPQCTIKQFSRHLNTVNECPADTAVGVAEVMLGSGRRRRYSVPVFNLPPTEGEPARFGFFVEVVPVFLDTSVRTGGDYGVTVESRNLPQILPLFGAQVTLWGVPGDPRHNHSRGWGCLDPEDGAEVGFTCETPQEPSQAAFLTLPTSCGGPFESTVLADSWEEHHTIVSGQSEPRDSSGNPLSLDGCNRLNFDPSISVAPNGRAASTPTGLTVHEHIPQEETLNGEGLAQANVKTTTFTLPEGMQLSPSAADGLLACSDEQIGFKGTNAQTGVYEFTPEFPSCPEASKVATVRARTPLLPHELTGAVYLAAQNANPFGSLVGLYVVAQDPVSGVLIKAPGEAALNSVTGQITATFPHDPEVPYEDLELEFFGTARAPLTTPALCGDYTTQASVEPYSGNPPAQLSSTFEINSGPNGAPCSDPRPFQPGFESGTTNLQAGAYTPFELTMTRPDQDQTLSGVETQLPQGLVGSLSSVQLCGEPQANQGTCGDESLIGHTVVSAGLGGDPYTVGGGKVFITGPYKGAPFGLSILEPAVAGPFNLGTIVVRAAIRVDPLNSHLTVVTDPLPTIIDGIPIQIQHVNVSIDRPGFVFNPTSCEPMKITGTLSSTEGASAGVSSPFQVTNCASLAFKPTLSVSTKAKTSRTLGASLQVSLTLPAQAGKGTEANVAKVKVSLPKQLPSPLKTLQKACLEKVFAENPASCPVASQVGEAKVSTPLLSGPLTGKAYFVSHGGAKYPELIMVLVGEDGVTVQVHGETFISKQGITSATFSTVPDVPFSSFELTLPQREYPALTGNGSLCKGALLMPTEMVGQNGVVIKQNTKITVTGCPKSKKAAHKRKKARHKTKAKGAKSGRRGGSLKRGG